MTSRDETLRALVRKWREQADTAEKNHGSVLVAGIKRVDADELDAALAAPTEAAGVDAANTLPPTTCARLAELVAEYGAARKDDESPPVYNRRLTFAMKLSDILALAAQE